MQHEFCAGAVLYIVDDDVVKYVLVEESDGHVGFPKGHLENGETDEMCALREIWEETGIHATLIEGYRDHVSYLKANDVMKHVTYFVGTYSNQIPVHKADEVNGLHILPYEQAYKTLTYDNSKVWLEKANHFICRYEKLLAKT